MACTACKRDVKIVAKGLCEACYRRQRKYGDTEYRRKRNFCQINGCGEPVVTHGMCDKHRQRLRQHGHTDLKRDSWGALWKHPLRHSWMWMRRHKSQTVVCKEWLDDFLQFINDVGDRPSPTHKLYTADDSKPLGPDNYVWKRAITERVEGEDDRTYTNRRARTYRAVNQEVFKNQSMKKMYGLNRDEYDAMLLKQDGKCAICGNEEKMTIRGKKVALAIDHCHATGRVRSLVCTAHNRGMGLFGDNPALLRKAADYIEHHMQLFLITPNK